jgi:hypothetical protein
VDDDNCDVGACVVGRTADSCEAAVATTKVRESAAAAVARTSDVMWDFHRLL